MCCMMDYSTRYQLRPFQFERFNFISVLKNSKEYSFVLFKCLLEENGKDAVANCITKNAFAAVSMFIWYLQLCSGPE